jgi:parallel beta-helix repeat protein
MKKSLIIKVIIAVLLIGASRFAFDVQLAKSPDGIEYIYIKPDGSIDPPTPFITTSDNVTYHVAGDIANKSIIVQRSDMVIEGHNHVIDGNWNLLTGINLTDVKNVTLDHAKLTQFTYAMLLNKSNDCRILYNTVWDNWAGVWIESSLRGVINFNNCSYNNNCGIKLYSGGNHELAQNTVCSNLYAGISVWYSVNNNFIHNNASSNLSFGIQLYSSGGGSGLINNVAFSNVYYGISLYQCDVNWLTGNNASDNRFNFGVEGENQYHFTSITIDTTNHADGKPVYYIKGTSDIVYGSETNAGVIYLIRCNNITVRDLTLTNNGHGIFLFSTNESRIENVTVKETNYGVAVQNSRNNSISSTFIMDSSYGIWLQNSNASKILESNVTYNDQGIYVNRSSFDCFYRNKIENNFANGIALLHAHNNTVIENNIVKNAEFDFPPIYYGINLENSHNNTLFHNNLVENGAQARALSSEDNRWDDGFPSGGNYWSDYTGVDENKDGIGYPAYEIGYPNVDAYPLTGMFTGFKTETGYKVDIVCNSTINEIHYILLSGTIQLRVSNTTSTQTQGFCRLTIPHSLMSPPYQVTVNGTSVTPTLVQNNGTHSFIYVSYEHSTVEIIVIPEYPTATLLPILMLFTTLATILAKKKTTKPEFS